MPRDVCMSISSSRIFFSIVPMMCPRDARLFAASPWDFVMVSRESLFCSAVSLTLEVDFAASACSSLTASRKALF